MLCCHDKKRSRVMSGYTRLSCCLEKMLDVDKVLKFIDRLDTTRTRLLAEYVSVAGDR